MSISLGKKTWVFEKSWPITMIPTYWVTSCKDLMERRL